MRSSEKQEHHSDINNALSVGRSKIACPLPEHRIVFRSRSNTHYGSRSNTPFRTNLFLRRNTTPRLTTPLQKFCAECKKTNHNTADCWLKQNKSPPQRTSFTKKLADVKTFRPTAPPAQGKRDAITCLGATYCHQGPALNESVERSRSVTEPGHA